MDPDFRLFTSLRYDPTLIEVPSSGLDHAGWNYAHPSSLYMLDFHRDRMLRAAGHWGWEAAVQVIAGDAGLERLASFVAHATGNSQLSPPARVKVTLSRDGIFGYETSKVPEASLRNLFPRRLPPPSVTNNRTIDPSDPSTELVYEVLIDGPKTERSEYTHFKTTIRHMYDGARERARISLGDSKEVLIINGKDDSIMEGSTTTPYFWRSGRWTTPTVAKTFTMDLGSGGNDGTTRRWALERYVIIPRRSIFEARC